MSGYIVTIGLEIHCELKTKSKIFCTCPNAFGGAPNTHVCPTCLGMPGTLPVLNRTAAVYTVRTGLALGSTIPRFSKWDRKNYFYPDLPKAWQTSQYDLPLVVGGGLTIRTDAGERFIRLNRIHLEEDAGKLVHEDGVTKVDYNRGGVPLMEIVTEPDMHSVEEVTAFLDELKSVIQYIGVSDAKMQEGSLRCDVNLSLSKPGQPLGTRTETKNLNSFSAAARAIRYETARQTEILDAGGTIEQETRRWDDVRGVGYPMRSKENAHDYRYFPEPDLLPVVWTDEDIEQIRARIPRLKGERIAEYTGKLGLSAADAALLTADKALSDLFEAMIGLGAPPKKAANLLMGDILRLSKVEGTEDLDIRITAAQGASLLSLIDDGTVSLTAVSKDILPALWGTDTAPAALVERLGLTQSNDAGEAESIVRSVIAQNPRQAEDYRAGNEKLLAYFVGQVMKASKGKLNPKLANELVVKLLSIKE